jgi:ferric-dicitrate binding protein FerR (iron transport regulator)
MIQVLGTNFMVKDYEDYFEVVCYEGKVQVTHRNKQEILTAGMVFRSINGKITTPKLSEKETVWSSQYEYFKSVPLSYVIDAIERNYGVTILNPSDAQGVFTGKISYSELNNALQSISIPFGLTTETKDNTILLKSK